MGLKSVKQAFVAASLVTLILIGMYLPALMKGTSAVMRVKSSRYFGDVNVANTPEWAMQFSKLVYAERRRQRRVTEVSCRKIFDGDKGEIKRAKDFMAVHRREAIPDETYVHLTKNCTEFIRNRGYQMRPMSDEEASFPIAFSILLYIEAEQAERLLRAIYQPQNVYCLHVDAHSPHVLHQAMQGIAHCFPNVFLASESVPVVYATFRQLQGDINCMKDLDKSPVRWKYFVNLASRAFPMKTNAELVKIFKVYNGANDIEGEEASNLKFRWETRHRMRFHPGAKRPHLYGRYKRNKPPPYNITVVKGSALGAFSREMVHFIVTDPRAKALFEWAKSTSSPEEIYWSTLHHLSENPHLNTPGGWKGKVGTKPWLASLSFWGRCDGGTKHNICVYGMADLHHYNLEKRKELFANKFFLTKNYLSLDCMEEMIYNRTTKPQPFDLTYYKQLPFIIQPIIIYRNPELLEPDFF